MRVREVNGIFQGFLAVAPPQQVPTAVFLLNYKSLIFFTKDIENDNMIPWIAKSGDFESVL